jgi:hypothetical protein
MNLAIFSGIRTTFLEGNVFVARRFETRRFVARFVGRNFAQSGHTGDSEETEIVSVKDCRENNSGNNFLCSYFSVFTTR